MSRYYLAALLAATALHFGCGKDSDDDGGLADTGADAIDDAGADTDDVGTDPADDGTSDVSDTSDTADVDPDSLDADPDVPEGTYSYSVPLDPESPWPKFRRDARQTAASPVVMTDDGRDMWVFETGKGIFSSPVIGGDGTVYVGSADRYFYAINPDGTERWSFETHEIIDSSALLDNEGRVIFGSGDGNVYALDAETGDELWAFAADGPSVNSAFINWFEGNVAIGPDGNLYIPNDNFFVYAVDRQSGEVVWRFRMPDQTWSLPAVDVETGNLYIGNNNLIPGLGNAFGIDSEGNRLWLEESPGTIAASPVLADNGLIVMGGFDGFIRAHDPADGAVQWEFAAQDHVYASTSQHPDGFLVTPTADGSVYAVDPDDGSQVWAFDWGAPIRSSAAVDGEGNIYMGTGDGHVLVLNPDGTLRWALRVIFVDRDDLNSSPAIGEHAFYVAGENGNVFGVPYDYCLRDEQADNENCTLGPDESLPADGTFLLFTTNFGTLATTPPATLGVNQPAAFTLRVRENGDTALRLIDTESVAVTITPDVPHTVSVSADRRFLTVTPDVGWGTDIDGNATITVTGDILENPDRVGLRMTGGTAAGSFDESYTFEVTGGADTPFEVVAPAMPGDAASTWEMRRLAAPLPTLLPSYNQIGFDSLHFLVGMVEFDGTAGVAWVVEGRPTGPMGETEVAPDSRGVYPAAVHYEDGALSLVNNEGASLEVMSAVISFEDFSVYGLLDSDGGSIESATVRGIAVCGDIPLYGTFLQRLGLCNPDSDTMVALGAVLLEPFAAGAAPDPGGVTFATNVDGDAIVATLDAPGFQAADHNLNVLLVDAMSGRPVSLPYGLDVDVVENMDGTPATVTIPFGDATIPMRVRAYLMVDTYPVAVDTITVR